MNAIIKLRLTLVIIASVSVADGAPFDGGITQCPGPRVESSTALAFLDAGPLAPPSTPFRWDVPNVVSNIDMPGTTYSMGVPVKMRAVTVKGNMEDTMRYMYDSFVKQGLYVDSKLLNGPILTGVEPATLITYSAVFQKNAPGYVTVVLGEANIRLAKTQATDDFVPLFPGAKGAVRSNTEGVDTLVYVLPTATEEKVRSFYNEAMGKAGWQRDPKEAFVFLKCDQEITLRFQQTGAQVNVLAMRRRRNSEP